MALSSPLLNREGLVGKWCEVLIRCHWLCRTLLAHLPPDCASVPWVPGSFLPGFCCMQSTTWFHRARQPQLPLSADSPWKKKNKRQNTFEYVRNQVLPAQWFYLRKFVKWNVIHMECSFNFSLYFCDPFMRDAFLVQIRDSEKIKASQNLC